MNKLPILGRLMLLAIGLAATANAGPESDNGTSANAPEKDLALYMGGKVRSVPHWKSGRIPSSKAKDFWLITKPSAKGVPIDAMAIAGGFEYKDQWFDGTLISYKIKLLRPVASTLDSLKRFGEFQALEPIQASDKLDAKLAIQKADAEKRKWARSGTTELDPTQEKRWIEAIFSSEKMPAQINNWCTAKGLDSCQRDPSTGYIRFHAPLSKLDVLSQAEEIEELHGFEPPVPLNDISREFTGVNSLQADVLNLTSIASGITSVPSSWNAGLPYTGEGVWVGVFDEGAIDGSHPDFQEDGVDRMADPQKPWTVGGDISEHTTHVAGIIAGNGRNSEKFGGNPFQWRGVAPKTRLKDGPSDVTNKSMVWNENGDYFSNILDKPLSLHQPDGPVTNTSTGTIGVYGAGNNGVGSEDPPQLYGNQQGYFSILASPLNHIKVGAVTKGSGRKCGFSSLGPTRDGRIGPDVMAPGCGEGPFSISVKIDYLALKTSAGADKMAGSKALRWDFNPTDPASWMADPTASNLNITSDGWLNFSGFGGTQVFTDFFNTAQINSDDHFQIRMRVDANPNTIGLPNLIRVDLVGLYYTDPTSAANRTGWSPTNGVKGVHVYLKPNQDQVIDVPAGIINNSITESDNTKTPPTITTKFWGGLTLAVNGNGDEIISTAPGGGYMQMPGTSMAAPHVTGIVALMLQKFAQNNLKQNGFDAHSHLLWNSTARAILIHTATDMVQTAQQQAGIGAEVNPDFLASNMASNKPNDIATEFYGVGPDWATGYGLVNAKKALDFVDPLLFHQRSVDMSATQEFKVSLPANLPRFRSTLVWDDLGKTVTNNANANPFPSPLVTNLEFQLISPSGATFLPWLIDPIPLTDVGNPYPAADGIDKKVTRATVIANQARRGVDNLNNVQVIDVDAPVAGTWTLRVLNKKMTAGTKQDFSLVSDFPLTESLTGFSVFDGTGQNRLLTIPASGTPTADPGWQTTLPSTGFMFKYNGTNKAGIQRKFGVGSFSKQSLPGTSGGIVIRNPSGTTVFNLGQNGIISAN